MTSLGVCQEQTRLTQAVLRDDVRLVKQLLAQGDEINRTNKAGYTPLMIAVSRTNLDIVNTLLAEGADMNAKSWYGWNALYSAAIKAEPTILKALLKSRVNVNIADDNGLTPVMGAALWARQENVEILRHAGATFTNDLVFSSALGQLDNVRGFVTKGENVNAWNVAGRSALAAAAANGHLAVINFLLEHAVDVNSAGKDGDVTNSALIFAAQNGRVEVVKLLLSKHANISTNSTGDTPLSVAVEGGHLEVVKLLLDQGADPNGKKSDGEPLLFSAAQKHADIIAPLLNAGADINVTNKFGSTALIIAAYYGNVDSVLNLLARGARLSVKTTEGYTAIQVARTLRDREQIIEILSNPDEAVKNAAKFKSTKPITPIDSKTLKKSQWREKIRPYWNPGGPIKVATISEFKNIFGEPSKTQSAEGNASWYYQCSDGTIQIELIDPNMSGGRMIIKEINDY